MGTPLLCIHILHLLTEPSQTWTCRMVRTKSKMLLASNPY